MKHSAMPLLALLTFMFVASTAQGAMIRADFHADRAGNNPGMCNDYLYECPESIDFSVTFDTQTYEDASAAWIGSSGQFTDYRFRGIHVTEVTLLADGINLWTNSQGLTLRGDGADPGGAGRKCYCYLAGSEPGGRSFVAFNDTGGQWPFLGELGEDPLATFMLAFRRPDGPYYTDVTFTGEWGELGNMSGGTTLTTVPLPPTAWLLGTGLAGLGGRRWRRRKISS